MYNTAYFVVRFTEIQAGRDKEKVPQSGRIFPMSPIQNYSLNQPKQEIKKSGDRVLGLRESTTCVTVPFTH